MAPAAPGDQPRRPALHPEARQGVGRRQRRTAGGHQVRPGPLSEDRVARPDRELLGRRSPDPEDLLADRRAEARRRDRRGDSGIPGSSTRSIGQEIVKPDRRRGGRAGARPARCGTDADAADADHLQPEVQQLPAPDRARAARIPGQTGSDAEGRRQAGRDSEGVYRPCTPGSGTSSPAMPGPSSPSSLVLLVAVGALLWYVVFPWATPLLPFDNVQVGTSQQHGPAARGPERGHPRRRRRPSVQHQSNGRADLEQYAARPSLQQVTARCASWCSTTTTRSSSTSCSTWASSAPSVWCGATTRSRSTRWHVRRRPVCCCHPDRARRSAPAS